MKNLLVKGWYTAQVSTGCWNTNMKNNHHIYVTIYVQIIEIYVYYTLILKDISRFGVGQFCSIFGRIERGLLSNICWQLRAFSFHAKMNISTALLKYIFSLSPLSLSLSYLFPPLLDFGLPVCISDSYDVVKKLAVPRKYMHSGNSPNATWSISWVNFKVCECVTSLSTLYIS